MTALARAIAYCLTAPIHCRNQYLTYRQIQWHSSEPSSWEIPQPSIAKIAGKLPMENLFQISHGPISQQTVRQTIKLPALQDAEKLIWIFTCRICVSCMSMHAYMYIYMYIYVLKICVRLRMCIYVCIPIYRNFVLKSAGHWWIPLQRPVDAKPPFSLLLA